MKRQTDRDHALLFTPRFPSQKLYSSKRYMSLIGVGGNLGNVKRRFDRLYDRLLNDRDIDPLRTSALFINPDFTGADTPPYMNAVILIATDLSPMMLLNRLNRIEARFGRVRTYKNAPRTLDLDIIFFETKTLYNERLSVPHPAWSKRASVLVPMLTLKF